MLERALIISDAAKANEFFAAFLREHGIGDIRIAADGPAGKRALSEDSYDICLVNSPLGGRSAEPLARELSEQNAAQVLLFIRSEYYEDIAGELLAAGVLAIEKPIHPQSLAGTLRVIEASEARLEAMRSQLDKMMQKLEETKVVSRAKCILIEKQGMTEADAHRYIEKQAMDRRVSRRTVAEDILDFYA